MSKTRLSKLRIEHSFSIVPNHITFSDELTLSEKGALIWLLAKPENYGINQKSLATHWQVGTHTVKRISKKLQSTGYLEIQRFSSGETIWHLTDTPIKPNKPSLDKVEPEPQVENRPKASKQEFEPQVEKPHVENRPVLERTDLLVRTDPLAQAINKNEIVDYDNTTINNISFDHEFEHIAGMGGYTGDIENEFFKFIGHHRSKGTGYTNRSRWMGAWQKWIGTAKGFQTAKQQPRQTQQDDITNSLDSTDWAREFNAQGRIIK